MATCVQLAFRTMSCLRVGGVHRPPRTLSLAFSTRSWPRTHCLRSSQGRCRPTSLLHTRAASKQSVELVSGVDALQSPKLGKRTLTFPDGSSYVGEMDSDGRLNGQGTWDSGRGDSFVGDFINDDFARGCYTDAEDNKFVGRFEGGAWEGPGAYLHADGRVQIGVYRAGEEVGEGACWSSDASQAWARRDGEVEGELSLAAADAVAARLGIPIHGIYAIQTIPVPDTYAMSAGGRARLEAALSTLHLQDAATRGEWEGYLPARSLEGEHTGSLVVHSTAPLVDAVACEAVVAECEELAARMGGWTTERHESYPTTDFPLEKLPHTLTWLTDILLPDVVVPFVAAAFGWALPAGAAGALRVSDAFVVKYDVAAGQSFLRPHRDGSVFSFNIALNPCDDYEGGGTYFRQLARAGGGAAEDDEGRNAGGALRSDQGHLLVHSSALMHGGHPIRTGVRYILVAFVTVEPEYAAWGAAFYQHVRDLDGPEEDGGVQ